MVFLPGLAVVFVGIVGNGAGKIDHQVKGLLSDAHVQTVAIPAASVAILAHHGEGCGDLVRRLHVDGVVGGELVTSHGHQTLRLAIYVGDGGLKSLAEIPLSGPTLTHDELDVLRSNLEDDVLALAKAAPKEPAPAPIPAPVAVKPAPAPTPVAVKAAPAPTPAMPAAAAVAAKSSAPAMDDEDPFAKTAVAAAPRKVAAASKREPEPKLVPRRTVAAASTASSGELAFPDDKVSRETQPQSHAPAAEQTADASESVSADDIEAMMKGGGDGGIAGGGDVAVIASSPELRLHGAIGFGLAGRSFSPGPATVPGYSSSPVGSIRFDAGVEPTPRIALAISGERTLQMTTPMANTMAATTMSRWEAVVGYSLVRGRIDLSPMVGMGHRSFSIDSTDPSRSPDGDYNYLILGAKASLPLGHRLALRGVAALEPVVSGTEPTEMAFGEASRWAFDVGAAIEARLMPFVFVRAAVDYQSFTWSWDMAGVRGAGGAVDTYPSGTLSLGAQY